MNKTTDASLSTNNPKPDNLSDRSKKIHVGAMKKQIPNVRPSDEDISNSEKNANKKAESKESVDKKPVNKLNSKKEGSKKDNKLTDYSHIKVIAVAQTQQQRLAFSDTVQSMGMVLLDSISPNMISPQGRHQDADVWLIDSEYDESLSQQLSSVLGDHPQTILMGFSKAPFLNETYLYAKWQRKLKRKFAKTFGLPDLVEPKVYNEAQEEWRYVVFLGASMGGPIAVKEFLDALSPELPVTLILAHHFNEKMIHTLPRILNRHNEWRCQIISTSQMLQSGTCFIAPITNKVVFDSTGRVILTQDVWNNEYKPCIGDLLKNTSDVYGNELIGVIFSGMGEDGIQHIENIRENQSHIWAQEPSSSACPSQPQSMIDTGVCEFIGTPTELAARLTSYVESQTNLARTL